MITETNTTFGLVTPGNSQELRDFTDEQAESDMVDVLHDQLIHNVEWIDTDASEDEDYLPQNQHTLVPSPPRLKRSRSNSVSTASSAVEEVENNESPGQKVRKAIDVAVDTGVDSVDLSCLGLTELPTEFLDVQYITVIKKDSVKNTALKLYLSGNQLTVFPTPLFALKNLSVLSLRTNRLEIIPPEIGLLKNLVEVSVGNNLLRHVPAELVELPLLTILNLTPNPFLTKPSAKPPQQPSIQLSSISVPTLVEIMSREILKDTTTTIQNGSSCSFSSCSSSFPLAMVTHDMIPDELRTKLVNVSEMNACHACHKKFCQPAVEQINWRQVFGRPDIPITFRYCSIFCSHHDINLQQQ
ncbi:hypothetical protein BDA99DRAFT_558376 [Phascolomyces articulosus]|uniref:Uncharacterized protein n=1 Tax=Phascolomyces articulosus TaxID=60185 RepID=A0AAD5PFU9_9FUNG|nr:hypothetical protein BDA99DRAFT_558376 [Phascolomyces articulosus]